MTLFCVTAGTFLHPDYKLIYSMNKRDLEIDLVSTTRRDFLKETSSSSQSDPFIREIKRRLTLRDLFINALDSEKGLEMQFLLIEKDSACLLHHGVGLHARWREI